MTPAYCSPEQADIAAKCKAGIPRHQWPKLTRRTDIWSWGVSVFEVFCGEPPCRYGGQLAAEVFESYLESGIQKKTLPHMPKSLADLLRWCFQENPDDRPPNMIEIVSKLKEIYQQTTGKEYFRQEPKAAELLADSLNNRAMSFLDLGKQEKAEEFWSQALNVQPHHPESTYNMGLTHWRSGRITDDALVGRMEEVLKSHELGWIDDYLMGLVHLERDDCESALNILTEISETDKNQEEISTVISLAKERLPQSRKLLQTFEGHKGPVTSVSLSHDGRYALSGGGDKKVKLWEIETGRCLRIFEEHINWVSAVRFSPDGHLILSGSKGGVLRVWETETGRSIWPPVGHNRGVTSISLSCDGNFALSGSEDKTLKLWEVATGNCLRTFEGHVGAVTSVCLSSDGHYALSGSEDGTLKLWEVETGRCLRTFEGHTYDTYEVNPLYPVTAMSAVHSLCFSQDGRYALSGGGNKLLKLWDVETGRCLRTFEGHTNLVNAVVMSPDGRYVLSGSSDCTLRLWDVEIGRCLRTFEGHIDQINSVDLSHDGNYALSGSGAITGEDYTLKFWKTTCTETTYSAPFMLCRARTSETVFSAQKTYKYHLAAVQEALVQREFVKVARYLSLAKSQPGYDRGSEVMDLWTKLYHQLPRKDLRGAWEHISFEGHNSKIRSVTQSSDGCYALSGSWDKTLKLWDTKTGRCLRTFEGHLYDVNSVALSSDRRYALSGGGDNTLKLWEVETGNCLRTFEAHANGVNSVYLSNDGCYALSGGGDGTLKLWEVQTGRCLRTFTGHKGVVQSVFLSADGLYALSGSSDNTLKLWQVPTGRCLQTFEGHVGFVESGVLSFDNRYALSGSWDGALKLWETETGRCLRTFEGHEGVVTSVALGSDQNYVLSGSGDKTLKLWEITTGTCVRTFEGHTDNVRSVSMSQDGRHILSAGGEQVIRLWMLDWELEEQEPADWDEGVRPYLEIFLTQQTLYAAALPRDREPTEEEITLALTRQGQPTWSEEDFHILLYTLGCAGYGWIRPDSVRKKLEEII